MILSYYSVVAGWALHYTWLSVTDTFVGMTPDEIKQTFSEVYVNEELNIVWHLIFMTVTIGIVVADVRGGIELLARILMPCLFVIFIVLVGFAFTTEGFSRGWDFVFAPKLQAISAKSVLEALGHSFFTLSLGMGAIIIYGSYLRTNEDIVTTSIVISIMDTAVAPWRAL